MEESSANQASLTVLGGPKAGLRFVIEDSVDNIVIGSDPSCRFHIDLPGVSPVHARLWVDPQGVTVYETNSPRGLYVNDDRVVAQATLRNGDILWLGTPGDEEVVMIQCRLPQGKALARVAPQSISEDAMHETVALGALPAEAAPEDDAGAAFEPAAVAEPETEPEPEREPEVQAEAEPEPEASPETAAEGEPEPTAAFAVEETPNLAAPATEVFMVDDSLYRTASASTPSAPPPESAHFELDFSRSPASFEEGLSARAPEPTLAMPAPPAPDEAPTLAAIAPPTPPAAPAPPSYPAPAEAARARETSPPARPETPAPVRAEPPPRQRRPPARPAPVAPPPAVDAPEAPAGSSAALRYGLLGAGILVVAVAAFVAVRLLRAPAAPQPTPPPPTLALAPPPTAAQAPAETPPLEASPSAEPQPPATIPEEVVVVPSAPSAPPPTAVPSRPPTPSPRATPSPRPTPRTTATPPPTAAPVQQAASQVPGLLGQAAAAVSARQFDAAVAAFDEVLKVDPQNASAAQGKAAAQASAASYKRGFAAGRTRLSGKESKADLGGFETTGVKVAKVPDYSGRIEFEVTPPRVLPGDSYTVRVYLVNDGKKEFKIGAVSVVTLVNGSRSGGPVAVRAREIAPRDRVLLDERTAEWAAGTTSWSLEAVVGSDRDATFTSRLNWR